MNMRAITLTELLVATTVIGIIMIGVVSSDSAIRKNAQNQNAGTLLTLNTRALVNVMISNASLATGYKSDPGFDFPPNAVLTIQNTPPSSFCVRQDMNINTKVPNNTPEDYSDDRWACYTVIAPNLYACLKASKNSSCLASDTLVGPVVSLAVNFNDTSDVFSVTIVNRADPTQAKSISNPEVTVSARVSPPGQSI